jgi:hypothetical protein
LKDIYEKMDNGRVRRGNCMKDCLQRGLIMWGFEMLNLEIWKFKNGGIVGFKDLWIAGK